MVNREEFLAECLIGWTEAQQETKEWIDYTKSEKKAMAKEALEYFDKLYFGLSMVSKISQDINQSEIN